jgi:hypothetical protein
MESIFAINIRVMMYYRSANMHCVQCVCTVYY